MSRTRRMNWLPPFVVGLSAAIAAEVAVGLLLYVTPGFLRALTLILAVMLSSLALGLWTAPHSDEGLTERLRRRWLLVLFAFAGGSVIAGLWSVRGGLSESASTQGLGLALLAALPLYSCGALLGGMSAPRLSHVRGAVGPAAAAGAAFGTILAGYVLAAVLHPVSIYAFCLVLLSGAAIVHGGVIAAEGERKRLLDAPSPYGRVRAEDWSWGKKRREKVLIENGRVRGLEDGDGNPVRKWEGAALELISAATRALDDARRPGGATRPLEEAGSDAGSRPLVGEPAWMAEADDPIGRASPIAPPSPAPEPSLPSVLILGGGALTLPRLIRGERELRVEVVERNPGVLEAARTHFAPPEEDPQLRVRVADPRAAVAGCPDRHVAVVVDSSAWAPQDPLPVIADSELEALRTCVRGDGLLIVGGIDREAAQGAPIDRLVAEAQLVFGSIAVYVSARVKRAPLVSHAPAAEMLLVLSPLPDYPFPGSAGNMTLDAVSRRQEPAPPSADGGEDP